MSGPSSSGFSFGGSSGGDSSGCDYSGGGSRGLRDRGSGVGRRDRPGGLSYWDHYGGGEVGEQMRVALIETEDRGEVLDRTAEGRRRHRAGKFEMRRQNQIGVRV